MYYKPQLTLFNYMQSDKLKAALVSSVWVTELGIRGSRVNSFVMIDNRVSLTKFYTHIIISDMMKHP